MITDRHKQIISQIAKIHARSIFKDHEKQQAQDNVRDRNVDSISAKQTHDAGSTKMNLSLTK